MTASDAGEGTGPGGTHYKTVTETFDAVPYTSADFHPCVECASMDCEVIWDSDAVEVRNCQLGDRLD